MFSYFELAYRHIAKIDSVFLKHTLCHYQQLLKIYLCLFLQWFQTHHCGQIVQSLLWAMGPDPSQGSDCSITTQGNSPDSFPSPQGLYHYLVSISHFKYQLVWVCSCKTIHHISQRNALIITNWNLLLQKTWYISQYLVISQLLQLFANVLYQTYCYIQTNHAKENSTNCR